MCPSSPVGLGITTEPVDPKVGVETGRLVADNASAIPLERGRAVEAVLVAPEPLPHLPERI